MTERRQTVAPTLDEHLEAEARAKRPPLTPDERRLALNISWSIDHERARGRDADSILLASALGLARRVPPRRNRRNIPRPGAPRGAGPTSKRRVSRAVVELFPNAFALEPAS